MERIKVSLVSHTANYGDDVWDKKIHVIVITSICRCSLFNRIWRACNDLEMLVFMRVKHDIQLDVSTARMH